MTARLGLIWMHGLGDTSEGWLSLKQQVDPLLKAKQLDVTWVFPEAPIASVTINAMAEMTSWFDIVDWPIGLGARDDPEGLSKSVALIEEEINKLESAGVARDKIVVGGFSQGGSVALSTVYRSSKKLAGCVCLSGWLQVQDKFVSVVKSTPNEKTPLFWGHGMFDEIVLPQQQDRAVETIQKNTEIPVIHAKYRTGHSSHPVEIEELTRFLIDTWTLVVD